MVSKTKPSKGKDKPRKVKSFSEMHGSKSPIHPVSGEQLGHDQQLPVNPPTPMGSPLLNPGQQGHPMGASMDYPQGEEFY